jgi:hypothetical protein
MPRFSCRFPPLSVGEIGISRGTNSREARLQRSPCCLGSSACTPTPLPVQCGRMPRFSCHFPRLSVGEIGISRGTNSREARLQRSPCCLGSSTCTPRSRKLVFGAARACNLELVRSLASNTFTRLILPSLTALTRLSQMYPSLYAALRLYAYMVDNMRGSADPLK